MKRQKSTTSINMDEQIAYHTVNLDDVYPALHQCSNLYEYMLPPNIPTEHSWLKYQIIAEGSCMYKAIAVGILYRATGGWIAPTQTYGYGDVSIPLRDYTTIPIVIVNILAHWLRFYAYVEFTTSYQTHWFEGIMDRAPAYMLKDWTMLFTVPEAMHVEDKFVTERSLAEGRHVPTLDVVLQWLLLLLYRWAELFKIDGRYNVYDLQCHAERNKLQWLVQRVTFIPWRAHWLQEAQRRVLTDSQHDGIFDKRTWTYDAATERILQVGVDRGTLFLSRARAQDSLLDSYKAYVQQGPNECSFAEQLELIALRHIFAVSFADPRWFIRFGPMHTIVSVQRVAPDRAAPIDVHPLPTEAQMREQIVLFYIREAHFESLLYTGQGIFYDFSDSLQIHHLQWNIEQFFGPAWPSSLNFYFDVDKSQRDQRETIRVHILDKRYPLLIEWMRHFGQHIPTTL
jgi:hypothetical protein